MMGHKICFMANYPHIISVTPSYPAHCEIVLGALETFSA